MTVLQEGAALGAVLAAYQDGREVPNSDLYDAVRDPLGFTDDDYRRRELVGKRGTKHCLAQRKVRWFQQSLKRLNLLERVAGKRGVWRLRSAQDKELTPAQAGMTMVGFSTSLGLALWSSCDVFSKINEPIGLIPTSPPNPLAKPRKYGGPSEPEMVDFVCRSLEPMIKNLMPGGSLVVNVSNDVFLPGSPGRSLYVERLTLALHDRYALKLMDRLVFEQPSKPPGPMQWASKARQQLNVAWEPLLWFCPDPLRCFADNRRVLLPHTEKHQKLMARGGESRDAIYSDGAYRIRAGRSFAATTPGRIPRNILTYTHHGAEISQLRTNARAGAADPRRAHAAGSRHISDPVPHARGRPGHGRMRRLGHHSSCRRRDESPLVDHRAHGRVCRRPGAAPHACARLSQLDSAVSAAYSDSCRLLTACRPHYPHLELKRLWITSLHRPANPHRCRRRVGMRSS